MPLALAIVMLCLLLVVLALLLAWVFILSRKRTEEWKHLKSVAAVLIVLVLFWGTYVAAFYLNFAGRIPPLPGFSTQSVAMYRCFPDASAILFWPLDHLRRSKKGRGEQRHPRPGIQQDRQVKGPLRVDRVSFTVLFPHEFLRFGSVRRVQFLGVPLNLLAAEPDGKVT